jgi:hypothetical protein
LSKGRKKGHKKSEVDAVIRRLTGYSQQGLEGQLKKQTDFETSFKEAPKLNPSRTFDQRYNFRRPSGRHPRAHDAGNTLSRLVDELAKGKAMEKILRA